MSAARKAVPARQARSVARLAAVQALYQMEAASAGVETVLAEFTDHRFDGDIEGETLAEADELFFSELVHGVVGAQSAIDSAITHRLATGWRLERLDATLRTHTFATLGAPGAGWYRIGAVQSAGLSLTAALAWFGATVEEAAALVSFLRERTTARIAVGAV